jgi:SnoaL-like polyketide cyclase
VTPTAQLHQSQTQLTRPAQPPTSAVRGGASLGIPATDREVTVGAWTIDRFADGKIAESRLIMNGLGLMQQLGVVPPPA